MKADLYIQFAIAVALHAVLDACARKPAGRNNYGSLDASAIPFFVERVSPLIVTPGSDATIFGYLFKGDFLVQINDIDVEIKSKTESEIVFSVPDFAQSGGVYDLALSNDNATRTMRIGIGKMDELALYSGKLDDLCDDQTVVNASGDVVRGLRDCDARFAQSPPVVIEQPAPVEGTPPCKIDGQSNCIVNSEQISLQRSKLTSESIVLGREIAGVVGTSAPLAADCNRDGQTNCTATPSFPSVDSSQFIPQNIRAGQILGGIPGAQKFCKSGMNVNAHNTVGSNGSALESNHYDTIDDFGAKMGEIDDSPFGDDFLCNGSNSWNPMDSNGGFGTELDCDNPADNCILIDLQSQIAWTEMQSGFFTWSDAAEKCKSLDWSGISQWRLPTQKEALQSYIDGIEQVSQSHAAFGLNGSAMWTATSLSMQTGSLNHNTAAWSVYLDKGITSPTLKTGNAKVRCIVDL